MHRLPPRKISTRCKSFPRTLFPRKRNLGPAGGGSGTFSLANEATSGFPWDVRSTDTCSPWLACSTAWRLVYFFESGEFSSRENPRGRHGLLRRRCGQKPAVSGAPRTAAAGQSPFICGCSTRLLETDKQLPGVRYRRHPERFRGHGSPHTTVPLGTEPAGQPARRAGKAGTFKNASRPCRTTRDCDKLPYMACSKPRF